MKIIVSEKTFEKMIKSLIKEQLESGREEIEQKIAEWNSKPDRTKIDANLELANEMLNGSGVEVGRDSNLNDRYFGDIEYIFVNMGSSYIPTVIYDVKDGKYFYASTGDHIESKEYRKLGGGINLKGIPIISKREAREIASHWHGGQWTALYSFMSSGEIDPPVDKYIEEVAENFPVENKKDKMELKKLLQFFRYKKREHENTEDNN